MEVNTSPFFRIIFKKHLCRNGSSKRTAGNTLVLLTSEIAESKSDEKNIMTQEVIVNFINGGIRNHLGKNDGYSK